MENDAEKVLYRFRTLGRALLVAGAVAALIIWISMAFVPENPDRPLTSGKVLNWPAVLIGAASAIQGLFLYFTCEVLSIIVGNQIKANDELKAIRKSLESKGATEGP